MDNPYKSKAGLRRIWDAAGYSLAGLRAARGEAAFRQEVVLAAALVPSALLSQAGLIGKVVMIFSVFLVLIVELLNSAIEAAIDRISLERHDLAKRAKDFGSAAVFLSLVNLAVVWTMVLLG